METRPSSVFAIASTLAARAVADAMVPRRCKRKTRVARPRYATEAGQG